MWKELSGIFCSGNNINNNGNNKGNNDVGYFLFMVHVLFGVLNSELMTGENEKGRNEMITLRWLQFCAEFSLY